MEIGRLAQRYKDQKGTNTLFFIYKNEMPKGKKATYPGVISAYRPEKELHHRVRWTVGGNRVEYKGAVTTETANMTLVKLLLNSMVSTPNAKFITMDLKDFLSWHAHERSRIHEGTSLHDPRKDHKAIQPL